MHSSTTIALLGSLVSASVLPRQDAAPPSFKLESRLANGTSMGYFTYVVGGGGWFGALVDDIAEAKSLVLTDTSPQKASLVAPKDPSDEFFWNLGWLIGDHDSDQQEWVALEREQDVQSWTTGFSIDSDEENLLKFAGPRSPLIFGACQNIGLYRGDGEFAGRIARFTCVLPTDDHAGPQTALYWKFPGAEHAKTEGCADFGLHAIFD